MLFDLFPRSFSQRVGGCISIDFCDDNILPGYIDNNAERVPLGLTASRSCTYLCFVVMVIVHLLTANMSLAVRARGYHG